MLLLRWLLFLLLSSATDLAGVAPVGPAEAVEEAEEAIHGPRRSRQAAGRAHQPRGESTAPVEARRAAARALQIARVADAGSAGATVRKLPPPGSAADSSVDDH